MRGLRWATVSLVCTVLACSSSAQPDAMGFDARLDAGTDPFDAEVGGPDADLADASAFDGEAVFDSAVMDASTATVAAVEIGSGRNMFAPLAEHQIVDLIQGPQGGGRYGGHHIWHAMRITNQDPDELAFIRFIDTNDNGAERGRVERNAQTVLFFDDGNGGRVMFGVVLRIDDCCNIAERDMIMRVETEDMNGKILSDARLVRASTCPATGADVCP